MITNCTAEGVFGGQWEGTEKGLFNAVFYGKKIEFSERARDKIAIKNLSTIY